jgi:hypothetical protein
MKRRTASLALLVVIGLALLGCGGDSGGATTDTAPGVDVVETSPDAADTTADAPADVPADGTDVAEPLPDTEVLDVPDAPDAPDASDVTDVPDVPDTAEPAETTPDLPAEADVPPPSGRPYLAMGNYGDLIRYTVADDHSYAYVNETTGETGSGQYTVSADPDLEGVYVATTTSGTYYAIELADGVFVTSNPSGNASNRLVVGLPADLDLSTEYAPADLAGDYVYVTLAPSWNDFTYGGYRLNAGGTYTWGQIPMSADPDQPTFHFTDYVSGGPASGVGEWAVLDDDPSRVRFTDASTGDSTYLGTVYPGKAMMIDGGPGYGFTLGLRYPAAPVTQAQLAGTYRFIEVTAGGDTGVGWYQIPATGDQIAWWEKMLAGGDAMSGSASFHVFANFWGGVGSQATFDGQEFYSSFLVLPGQILMAFTYRIDVEPIQLISYSVGAHID